MGSYSDVPTDELIQLWKDTAEERSSMLEDNRDEDDQDHYDRLGRQLDEIFEGANHRGVKDWWANFVDHALEVEVTFG